MVEVLFTRRQSEEEHVLINVVWKDKAFVEGKEYLIEIQPAFPHEK